MEEKKSKAPVVVIVIVAILAVVLLLAACCGGSMLVSILAPQYIKYVEKTNQASDKIVIQNIQTAALVSLSDPSVVSGDGSCEIYVDKYGQVTVLAYGEIDNSLVGSEIRNTLGTITWKSSLMQQQGYSCSYVVTNGTVTMMDEVSPL